MPNMGSSHGAKGFSRFLRDLEKPSVDVYACDAIHDILKGCPNTLTVFSNEENRAILDKEVNLSLFHVTSRMEMLKP